MFCHKCGAKAIDGAEFCQKCGSKIIKNEAENNMAADMRSNTIQEQGTSAVDVPAPKNGAYVNAKNEKPAKKKSKKRFFIIGAVILVIIIIIAAAASGTPEMNYIETVKAYKPFANSQGLPYTCDEVFGKYIKSAVWEDFGDGDTRNVTVSGTIKGTDTDIAVTIKASPDPNDSERALMSPVSVKIGDDTTKSDASDILYLFFAIYDEGLDDLSEFKEEMSDLNVLLESIAEAKAGDITLSQTFNDSGISFKYPSGWEVLDSISEYTLAEIIYSENKSGELIRVNITVENMLDTDPLHVFSGDEQTIRKTVNEGLLFTSRFIEYRDTSIGGMPAKFLKYQTEAFRGLETILNYYYKIGEEVYCVSCKYTSSEEDTYKPIFEKIIDSYTIAANITSVQNTNASDDDASVRSAYIQKVQELAVENSDLKFNLIDITPNDVYELVADMPGYYVNVYVYDNGRVIPIMEEWGYGAGGNQGYQYLPGKNIILNTTLSGAGRDVYETYMCVDSNNKVVNVYDYDLYFSYPSSYYYGNEEISEFIYSLYQVHGEYNEISGNTSADDMIAALNSGTDIRSSVSGKILINGRTAESLLDVPINSIIKQWGEPLEYNVEGDYCNYDGISFEFYFTGMIYSVTLSPEICMIDGNNLDKYRDGIDEIFGTTEWEGWDELYGDLYSISYTDYSDDYNVYVYMESPDDKPDFISISQY